MKRRLQSSWKTLIAAAGLAAAMLWGATAESWAAPLDDAKAAGLIGELPDGYVAAVQPNPPSNIAALVRQINAKRQAVYEDLATEENVPVAQVGALAAEKIKRQAQPGEYFMSPDGTWTQQ
jgi:uncharacterized protein